MSQPILLALQSLLPTLSPLPPALIDLSTSLLSQSRTRASALKPEEEIARTYACCHIACERLGKQLGLEIGRPMPPCPPKVYAKLKAFLSSTLRTPTTPTTPRRGRFVGTGSGRAKGEEGGTPRSGKTLRSGGEEHGMPSGRKEGLAASNGRKRKVDEVATAGPSAQEKAQSEQQPVTRHKEVADSDPQELDAEVVDNDDNEEPTRSTKRPSKTPLRRKEKHAKRPTKMDEEVDEDESPAGLQMGLGTMFQTAVDWLSEERREEFLEWKEGMMKQITALERRAGVAVG
jgi:origin recognition complex subunit 6